MKRNEQAKTHGQGVQSHCWSVVDIKDLHTGLSHQGLTELNYCTLGTLKIEAVKGDTEAGQPICVPARFPEVHQPAQSSPTDTTSPSPQLQPGNPPSVLRYSVKHLNNTVKNISFCCQSRNKSTQNSCRQQVIALSLMFRLVVMFIYTSWSKLFNKNTVRLMQGNSHHPPDPTESGL